MGLRKTRARARRRPDEATHRSGTKGASGGVKASAEIARKLAAAGVLRVKVGGFDIDGVLRGKYVTLDKLRSMLEKGFGFCDVIFGWDVSDVLYANAKVTGWHTGYPDTLAVLDPSTLRMIPWEPKVAALLCDFRSGDGGPHPACPRSLCRRMIERAQKLGFTAKFGAEYEFFLFKETRDSLTAKGFRDLQPLDPGMFGYSWVRSGQDADLTRDLMQELLEFDIEIEALHTETGPGVYEAALRYDDALRAADKAALFKSAVKQIAHRHGLSVTFMAKWNAALPGCSGHLHQSLWRGKESAFFDARAPRGMSRVMQQYIAGQLALMQDLTLVYSPTINSYKRYVPGVWAPLVSAWGVENRTCAVRVVGMNDGDALRVEYRQTAADMNPYLAIAGCLGAGLWGIEQELELPPETRGDPGDSGPLALPRTLRDALARFRASRVVPQIFGQDFVDHYALTREWEAECYERAVTDWELSRYFEVI
ncbi:MAG TPA: glutamine synthetase family protein [Polyangiaceae bacterium]